MAMALRKTCQPILFFSREGFLCGRVFYEFDGVDEADVADFAYVLMMAEGFHEFFVEVLAVFVDFVQDVIAFHDFQDFEGDGAAHRVACVGVAVDEGFVSAVVVVEGVIDFVSGDGDGHRHVACSEAFGCTEDVRADACVFDGKEFACAAKSGCDFVVDEEHAVLVTECTEFCQVGRRVHSHAGSALEDWLYDAGCGFFAEFLEGFFCAFEAFDITCLSCLAVRAAVAVKAFEMDIVHEERMENACVVVHGADGKGADGFTVVGGIQAHEFLSFRMAGLVVVLVCHLHRRFDSRGTIVVIGEFCESPRQELSKFAGELDGRLVGEVREDDVFECVDLTLQRFVDFRIAVAEEVAPPGGNDVEVRLAFGVIEVDALGMVDDDRRNTSLSFICMAGCQIYFLSSACQSIFSVIGFSFSFS